MTRENRRIQGNTGEYKRIQGHTGEYKGLREEYRGIQENIREYKGDRTFSAFKKIDVAVLKFRRQNLPIYWNC